MSELKRSKSNFIDFKLPENTKATTLEKNLKENPIIETLQINVFGDFFLTPNDPRFSEQWYLQDMGDTWEENTGSPNVTVAILDTGIDWNHPDLGFGPDNYQNIYINTGEDAWSNPDDPSSGNGIDDDDNGFIDDWRGWNFTENTPNIMDYIGHGTNMAGLISAKTNNAVGIASLAGGFNAPGVKILSVKIGDTPSSDIIDDAIDYAVDQGADVIQMAFGLGTWHFMGLEFPAIDAAIERAAANGVILVAAAGQNENQILLSGGSNIEVYPGAHPSVIRVRGYFDDGNEDHIFGHFGPSLDFIAPGADLRTTGLDGNYPAVQGTSGASAIVSGLIALMLSENRCLSQDQVYDALSSTAIRINEGQLSIYNYDTDLDRPGHSDGAGYGLIDPLAALLAIATNSESEITENTSLDGDLDISGDLVIRSGASLTVPANSTINMRKNTKIIVERGAKLIVDGGTIGSCKEPWRGIFVVGNADRPQLENPSAPLALDDSGVVHLKNGATIENARNAIASRHPILYWKPEYWGGLVVAENSFFIDNRRAVEFMKYDQPNKSRFTNTEFSFNSLDNYAAVTIWDTDDITFEGCTFNSYKSGIILWDAGANIINNNRFKGGDKSIEVFATSPVSSGSAVLISDNEFGEVRLDAISSYATDIPKQLVIDNNIFSETEFSISLSGPSTYTITENRFEGSYVGVQPHQTAKGIGVVNCNTFDNTVFGIAATGKCSGLSMIDNGFLSDQADISLWQVDNVSGEVASSQGTEGLPANNCFTAGNNNHIISYGNTEPFTYFVPDNAPVGDCTIPGNVGNFSIEETSLENPSNCILPFGPDKPDNGKEEYLNLQDRINFLLSGGNIQASGDFSGYKLSDLNRFQQWMLSSWLKEGLEQGMTTDLQDILLAGDSNEGLKQMYGLYLQRGELTEAALVLDEIRNQAGNTTFAAIQDINLARLQSNQSAFVLSEQQTALLEQAAASSSVTNSNHAKALLSLLKRRQFSTNFPYSDMQPLQGQFGNPSTAGINDQQAIRMAPNPTDDWVQLQHLPVAKELNIHLTDHLGRVLRNWTTKETPSFNISTAGLPKGIYYIHIKTNEKIIHLEQLLIVK